MKAVEEDSITIVNKKMEGRITITELMHQILRETSALIQANVWDDIFAEQRTKGRRLNNNDDDDITAIVNDLGSSIETLQDTVSRITDDQKDNGGGNNNNVGNNNGGRNAQNVKSGENDRSNGGNFGGSARRCREFYYRTTDTMEKPKVNDMNHVTKPTKPDTKACKKSNSHVYTCAGKNMTLFSYTGYKCNVTRF